ncbi:MAG: alpha/beta hydrolase [Kofleriaceae bacterium]
MSTKPDLAVSTAGPANGRPIVFIHGIAQSRRVFDRLLDSSLADRYRMIAFDLRGHGDSTAAGAEFTRARLADDLAAVIAPLDHPVLVPWSFGGVAVGEYLRAFGDGALGGLVYVAASVRTGRDAADLFGPGMMNHARALLSEDPAIYAAAARAFVADASAAPLARDLVTDSVAEMLRVRSDVRRPLLAGGEDYRPELTATRVPIATIHGELDQVVLPAMSDLVATCRSDVRAIRLAGVGHLPWLEAPSEFDAALAELL